MPHPDAGSAAHPEPNHAPDRDPRRALPRVDALAGHPLLAPHDAEWGRQLVVRAAQRVLAEGRSEIAAGAAPPSPDELAGRVGRLLDALGAGRVRAVVNATGVVLHTNLGRAPLSAAARAAVLAAAGYSTVEYDLATGGRGRRADAAHRLLRELTGAEGALVVNNAAAALLLALGALARDREVVVSRGELIEIGGEFRLPSVMQAAGARLVEVGTTNRTHLRDYADAVTEHTAMLLVVHPSNYRIQGFTATPRLSALAELAKSRGIPLLHDIGSGLLRGAFGDEPTLADSIGLCDLVVFSGDKLFGGPQAGMIVGRADLVATLARNPIARAVRIDKLTLAALEATLLAHLADRRGELPVWRSIELTEDDLRPRAERLAARLGPAASTAAGVSLVGGGSLPGHALPTVLVHVDPRPATDATLLARLRAADPPIVARADAGRVVLDLRTVPEGDDEMLATTVAAIMKELTN